MLEDSINSSPQKDSIHKIRMHRKNKRRRLEESMTENMNAAIDSETPILANMYMDDLDESAKLQRTKSVRKHNVHDANFDPFEDELLLTIADRLDSATARAQYNKRAERLPLTQNFQAVSDFVRTSQELKSYTKLSLDAGLETQLDCSDMKLLHFCEKAEHKSISNNVFHTTITETPQTTKVKSVVDSILEDFCSSPESPIMRNSEDSTPQFRFRNKTLRTYAKKTQSIRKSITAKLENSAIYIDEDDSSDCSSGLSVQEDLTLLPVTPEVSTLQRSQELCKNLLNLSAYLTKTSEVHQKATSVASSEEIFATALGETDSNCLQVSPAIPKLLAEIASLREKQPAIVSRTTSPSSKEFSGFSCKSNDSNPIVLTTPPASVVNASTEQKLETTQLSQLVSTFLEDVDQILQDADALIDATKPDVNASQKQASSSKDCDIHLSAKDGTKNVQPFSDDDDDEWNDDCDFFVNFKTQNVLQSRAPLSKQPTESAVASEIEQVSRNTKLSGLQTAQPQKQIEISNELATCAVKILKEVFDEPSTSKAALKCKTENFKTRNNENMEMGDLILDCQVQPLPIVQTKLSNGSNLRKTNLNSRTEAVGVQFLGFCTASTKPIKISAAAQLKAASILSELPEIPCTPEKKNIKENEQTSVDYSGFQTTLGKPEAAKICGAVFPALACQTAAATKLNTVNIKKKHVDSDAKLANIFDDLLELPQANNEFVGFRTAASKTIAVSAAAKLKVANIFTNLPEIPCKKEKNCFKTQVTELPNPNANVAPDILSNVIKDIQFSEWPVWDDEECVAIQEASTERKYDNVSHGSNKETPTPHTKFVRSYTTNDLQQRSPLNRIENQTLSCDDTEERQQCNATASTAFISRKNLLSLSKHKKRRISMNCSEAVVVTPTKKHMLQNAVAMQTPGTPNLREFFDAVPNTSTPHISLQIAEQNRKHTLKCNDLETDLKHINWDNFIDSTQQNSQNIADTSDVNSTSNNSNPSPKQRIERLSIYGNPPAVSPIAMSSNSTCRRLGLRRNNRSIVKKSNI